MTESLMVYTAHSISEGENNLIKDFDNGGLDYKIWVERWIEKQGIRVCGDSLRGFLLHSMNSYNTNNSIWFLRFNSPFKNSSKYLKSIFESQKIGFTYTEKGNPDFSNEALDNYEIEEDLKELIKDLRKYQYYQSLAKSYITLSESHVDSKIYPIYEFAVTGRYRCSSPNIQNLPKNRSFRSAILPLKDGQCLYSVDYSQGEYRLFVDYIGHKKLISDLNDGADYHQIIADMIGCKREAAKTINFAILYGAGPTLISKKLKVPYTEAVHLRNQLLDIFGNKGKDFIEDKEREASTKGYVTTHDGRTIKVDEPYKAVNYLIQGSLAVVVRNAIWFASYRKLLCDDPFIGSHGASNKKRVFDIKPYFNVHDAWVFTLNERDTEAFEDIIIHAMENSYKSINGIRMKLDGTIGLNYGEMNERKRI